MDKSSMKHLVLDTNILLLDANNLLTLGQDAVIVLPETVLDELDVKKTDKNPDLSYQARQFGRILTSCSILDIDISDERAIVTRSHDDSGVVIKTLSLTSYLPSNDSEVSIRNDRKILQATKYLADQGIETTFMSNDVMCRERAIVYGITATDLKLVEIKDEGFTKAISVPSSIFAKMHNASILNVDPDYQVENFNYVITDESTGQVKLANIRNGFIDILGKDTEQDLRRQDATPMNSGQLFLSRAIQNPNIDIVVCEALAGSGKTVSAFSNAIQLIKKRDYNSILYLRASVDDVDKVEAVGFLSGNEDKMAVYLHPVDDTLDFIARSRHKDSKLKGKEYEEFIETQKEEMVKKYHIHAQTGLGLRGRTVKPGTIVIIDEAQNQSAASLQKMITRVGTDCKVIIIGSNKQIDNPYETKHTNGLSVLLHECTNEQEKVRLHAVTLTKVLRSNIAEFAEKAFSKG
jgi:PhoH-like ATPase